MRHQEGMRVSLLEEGMLDSAGILTSTEGSTAAYGLTDEAVQLFLLIAAAGEEGLARSRIPRNLQPALTEHLLPLELQSLVAWERDNRGRLAYLVLTWKGEETLAAARPSNAKTESWAAKRKAAVTRSEATR